MNEKISLIVEMRANQAIAATDSLEQEMNQLRRETLGYRGSLQQLNAELAENRQKMLTADAAAKETLTTRNRQIAAESGLIRSKRESTSVLLADMQLQRREHQKLQESLGMSAKSAGIFRHALTEMGGTIAAIAIDRLVYGMAQFGRESVDAAVKVDAAKRSFVALTGSTKEAEIHLKAVFDLADQPGLKFESALAGAQSLKALGVPLSTIQRTLREFGNAAAFSGNQMGEFQRAMLGFRQIIQRGRVSQEELNQLTENLTLLSRAIKDEFGTVLAEEIQESLDAAGQDINDFVERVLSAMERLERFDSEAALVKFQQLENAILKFKAAAGDDFIKVLAPAAGTLKDFIDALTEADVAGGAATLGGLAAGLGSVALAMKTFMGTAAPLLKPIGASFKFLGTQMGFATTAMITLGKTWHQIYSDFQKTAPFEDAQKSIKAFNIATSQTAKGLGLSKEAFAEFSTETQSEIGLLLSRADELRVSLINATRRGDSAEASEIRKEYREIYAQLEKLGAATFKAKSGMVEAGKAIDALGEKTLPLITTTEKLEGVLAKVDTRFLTFHERGAALMEAIPPLSNEITGLKDIFAELTRTAEAVPPTFEMIRESAKQGLFDVVKADIDETNKALEGLHQKWINTARSITDISGAARALPDFTKSDAYAPNRAPVGPQTPGRRTYVKSPVSGSGSEKGGGIADLGIPDVSAKVREFEKKIDTTSLALDEMNKQIPATTTGFKNTSEKSDITLDVLDEMNIQTPVTTREFKATGDKLNQLRENELSLWGQGLMSFTDALSHGLKDMIRGASLFETLENIFKDTALSLADRTIDKLVQETIAPVLQDGLTSAFSSLTSSITPLLDKIGLTVGGATTTATTAAQTAATAAETAATAAATATETATASTGLLSKIGSTLTNPAFLTNVGLVGGAAAIGGGAIVNAAKGIWDSGFFGLREPTTNYNTGRKPTREEQRAAWEMPSSDPRIQQQRDWAASRGGVVRGEGLEEIRAELAAQRRAYEAERQRRRDFEKQEEDRLDKMHADALRSAERSYVQRQQLSLENSQRQAGAINNLETSMNHLQIYLKNIVDAVLVVDSSIQAMADHISNQPVQVSVNMDVGGQVIELINNEIIKGRKQGTLI